MSTVPHENFPFYYKIDGFPEEYEGKKLLVGGRLRHFVDDDYVKSIDQLNKWSFVEIDVESFHAEWKSRTDNASRVDFTNSASNFWKYLPAKGINVPKIEVYYQDYIITRRNFFGINRISVERNKLYVGFGDGRHRFYFFKAAGAAKMIARCPVGCEKILALHHLGRDITAEVRKSISRGENLTDVD